MAFKHRKKSLQKSRSQKRRNASVNKNDYKIEKHNLYGFIFPQLMITNQEIEELKQIIVDLKKYGNEEDFEAAKEGIKRALLNVKLNIARKRVAEEAYFEGIEDINTEEEILKKAVELINE